MDKYFYLIAQLPTLYFEREPLITESQFLEEACKWLSPAAYELLTRVDLSETTVQSGDPALIRQYKRFEGELRSELAEWRAARRRNQDFKLTCLPTALVKEGDPLTIEKNLLYWRWQYLEEAEPGHHFDFGFLLIYCLKLQILRRLFTFNKPTGMQKYQQYTETSL